MSPSLDTGARLAAFCRALGHPVRVTIVRMLLGQRRGVTCGDIVRQLPLAQSTVSEHLRVLKEAGLIETREEPSRVVYRASFAGVEAFRREAQAL